MATKTADFQAAELLNLNSLLQASITELRYRCEVYRLSLKSISKVLVKVHQETRLRFLTTSRRSFQCYLLLSQKNALGRIGNVVRKASTFINGYSLVDKRLFQPPPPKPGCSSIGKELLYKTTFPSPSPAPRDNKDLLQSSPQPSATTTTAETASHENENEDSQLEEGEIICNESRNNGKSDEEDEKVHQHHSVARHKDRGKARKHRGSRDARERKKKSDSDASGKRRWIQERTKKKPSKSERSEEEDDSTVVKEERFHLSKSNKFSATKLVSSNNSNRSGNSRLNQTFSSSWTNNSNDRGRNGMIGRNDPVKKLPSLLTMKMTKYNLSHRIHSNSNNSSRETFSRQQVNREKFQKEVKRANSRDRRDDDRRSGGADGKSASYKGVTVANRQRDRSGRNSTSQRQTYRKIDSNRDNRASTHRQTQSRNKIRESLAVIRKSRGTIAYTNANTTSSTVRQGQGVAPKYLFASSHGRRNSNNNGFKLPPSAEPVKIEKVKRVRLEEEREHEDDDHDHGERSRGCVSSSSSRKNAKNS